eukprot:TRINITY_DN8131_c0_g1_i35.p1 TRINITY_DN8131_c0_g1~~TRINITY_DN8131_c0_g1_i35.p1  ORF type:complete len:617 (-),score=126.37 TRINITY_DN8131_c0_g1_i35:111-1895(-)
MGPSGSGKSSLLNTLACRLDRGMKATGEMKINGRDYSRTELKWIGGYVMQDDVVNAMLTVEETLTYTAKLRLPSQTSREEIKERVREAMDKMGLAHTKDTIVGNPIIKGISGGERKRLCVAMELMTQPQLLFLDEPTSGLDSVSALSLCTRLKQIVDAGECTIICTIHQPQAKIFKLFDNLVLLAKGKIVYLGPANKVLKHFAAVGHPCPVHENPADHLLSVVSPVFGADKDTPEPDFKKMTSAPEVTDHDLTLGSGKPDFLPRDTVPWYRQFAILFDRSMKEQIRKWDVFVVQLVQAVLIAILIGTVFLKIGISQASVTTRQAVLFFCCINQGVFGALIVINSFPGERTLILRERMAGTYYSSAYFVSKSCVDSVTQAPIPIIFSVIVYWLVGFQATAGKFFIFTAFMVLCNFAATSLAAAVSAFGRTTDMAVTVLPMALEICRLFGGFFLPPSKLPAYFSWLDALSYVKYTYVGVALNELEGLVYNCTESQKVIQNGASICPVQDGNQVHSPPHLQVLPSTSTGIAISNAAQHCLLATSLAAAVSAFGRTTDMAVTIDDATNPTAPKATTPKATHTVTNATAPNALAPMPPP